MGAVVSFVGAHLDKAGLLYQVVETGLVAYQNSSAKRFTEGKGQREACAVVSTCFGLLGMVALLEGKLSWLSRSWKCVPGLYIHPLPPLVLGLGGLVALTLGFLVIESVVNRCLAKQGDLKELVPGWDKMDPKKREKFKEVKWDKLPSVCFLQRLTATRVIINLALAYFTANPYFLLATVALELVSVGIMARWNAVVYNRLVTKDEFPTTWPSREGCPLALEFTYTCPVSPAQLCEKHPRSEKEIVEVIHESFEDEVFDELDKVLTWKANEKLKRGEFAYEGSFAEEALPTCDEDGCTTNQPAQVVELEIHLAPSNATDATQANQKLAFKLVPKDKLASAGTS